MPIRKESLEVLWGKLETMERELKDALCGALQTQDQPEGRTPDVYRAPQSWHPACNVTPISTYKRQMKPMEA